MILDMNRDGVPDYDPITQDLYLYGSSNTGLPTGWNPNCVVYQYRDQLESRRARPRVFFNTNSNYPPPQGLTLSQRPNYYNNLGNGADTAPFIFLSENRGVFSCHYWLGGLYDRQRSLNPPDMTYVQSSLYFLNTQNQLVEYEKQNMLSGWTYLEQNPDALNSRKMPEDMALVEYSGTKLLGKKFPKWGPGMQLAADTFDSIFMIDSQDKVLYLTPTGQNFKIILTRSDNIEIVNLTISDSRILNAYLGDSGTQIYGIRNGIVYFLSHIVNASSAGVFAQIQFRNYELSGTKFWAPDWDYIQIEKAKIPDPKNTATQISLLSLKQIAINNQTLLEGLSG